MPSMSFLATFLCLLISSVDCANVTNYDYDHFIFAQQWAQSVCECYNSGSSDRDCRIPEGVSTWTIHGLWPTLGESEKPDYCNRSWHFEESKILDIENQLEIYWPQLLTSSANSRISFWAHEWKKHGTCCTDNPHLSDEHKYFAFCLRRNRKFDLLDMLKQAGIEPSREKTYELDGIRNAVQQRTGHQPVLHCCKSDGKQRIQEIFICIDKQFNPIDCNEGDENCSSDVPVYYEPLNPFNAI